MMYDSGYAQGWDCDPTAEIELEPYDSELDLEDDEGDWQVLALDRFGDRELVPYAGHNEQNSNEDIDPAWREFLLEDAAYRERLADGPM